jgi:hypothetical protein
LKYCFRPSDIRSFSCAWSWNLYKSWCICRGTSGRDIRCEFCGSLYGPDWRWLGEFGLPACSNECSAGIERHAKRPEVPRQIHHDLYRFQDQAQETCGQTKFTQPSPVGTIQGTAKFTSDIQVQYLGPALLHLDIRCEFCGSLYGPDWRWLGEFGLPACSNECKPNSPSHLQSGPYREPQNSHRISRCNIWALHIGSAGIERHAKRPEVPRQIHHDLYRFQDQAQEKLRNCCMRANQIHPAISSRDHTGNRKIHIGYPGAIFGASSARCFLAINTTYRYAGPKYCTWISDVNFAVPCMKMSFQQGCVVFP